MLLTNEEKRKIVLEGSLFKGLLILSLPIIINNFMQTIYGLVDIYWVSKMTEGSDLEVATVSGVMPITHMILAFGMGLYVTANSFMSQAIGAGERKKANFYASQSFSLALIIGLFFMVIGFIFAPFIANSLFQPTIASLASEYLGIIFFEVPILFAFLIFTAMRQANGDTLTPVIFSIISNVLNMVLDPLFILHFGWGMEGAAFATVLSKVFIVPFWLPLALFSRNGIRLNLKALKPHGQTIQSMMKVAIPSSVGQAINSAGFAVLQGLVNSYGDQTLAAYNMTNRVNSLAMMPAMGVGSALTFVIGQNIGNQNYERAKKAFRTCMVISLIFSGFGTILMLMNTTGRILIEIFLDDPSSIKLSLYFLKYIAFNTPLMAIFQSQMGIFNGSGKTTYSFVLTISRLWLVRIPLILFFKHLTPLGSEGLYIAMLLSNVLIIIIGFILYGRGKWQKRLIEHKSEVELQMNE